MNWIPLEQLLLKTHTSRAVSAAPAIDLEPLQAQALSLAAALQARGSPTAHREAETAKAHRG